MDDTPMMKCGHAANAIDKLGKPCCVICIGIDEGADQVDDSPPKLEERFAVCSYGRKAGHSHAKVVSSPNLAFFEAHPQEDTDEYYCGCHGWN